MASGRFSLATPLSAGRARPRILRVVVASCPRLSTLLSVPRRPRSRLRRFFVARCGWGWLPPSTSVGAPCTAAVAGLRAVSFCSLGRLPLRGDRGSVGAFATVAPRRGLRLRSAARTPASLVFLEGFHLALQIVETLQQGLQERRWVITRFGCRFHCRSIAPSRTL